LTASTTDLILFADYFNLSPDVAAMKRHLKTILDVEGKESDE